MGDRRKFGALLLAGAAVLGACSSNESPPQSPATPSTAEEEPEPSRCPLTGRVPPKGVDTRRPAVGLKVENDLAARPLSGLERADLVFEERVEGGITRFLAIFHCGESSKVGTVRSGRFDDPKIAKPFTRLLAASGSNSIVTREMKKRRMVYLTELDSPAGALFRDPPGSLDVHSLFANTEKLRKAAAQKKVDGPDPGIFEFGPLTGKAKKARSVTINFTSSSTIEYKWQGGKWKRFESGAPFKTTSGGQISVPNVVIQEVLVNNSKRIVDVAGNPSPDLSLEGVTGKALLFRNGKVIKGTWRMGKVGAPPKFELKGGKPMVFAPGPIWVELVPSHKGQVTGDYAYK